MPDALRRTWNKQLSLGTAQIKCEKSQKDGHNAWGHPDDVLNRY